MTPGPDPDPDPDPATFRATGQEGDHEGITYVEYEMLDSEGSRISLAADNVEYIKQDGELLEPNADETLWFRKEKPTGKYQFEVKTKAGKLYAAVLDWVKPDPEQEPDPEPES